MKLIIVALFAALCAVSLGEGENFDFPEESEFNENSKEPAGVGTRHSMISYKKCGEWDLRGIYKKRCFGKKTSCAARNCLYKTNIGFLKLESGYFIKVPLIHPHYPKARECKYNEGCGYCRKAKCQTVSCADKVRKLIKVNQYYYIREVYVPYPCCQCRYN